MLQRIFAVLIIALALIGCDLSTLASPSPTLVPGSKYAATGKYTLVGNEITIDLQKEGHPLSFSGACVPDLLIIKKPQEAQYKRWQP